MKAIGLIFKAIFSIFVVIGHGIMSIIGALVTSLETVCKATLVVKDYQYLTNPAIKTQQW